MLLYWIIFVIICLFAIKDWRKTVIAWLPIQLLFNECVCLKYDSPAVSFTLAIDSILIFCYFLDKNKKKQNARSFILKKVFIVYLLSYFLSMCFSIVPFTEVATNTLKYFIQSFGIIFVFYKAINSTEDIKLFVKTSAIVIVLIVSLGIYEALFKDNIVLDYVFMNAPLESINGKMWYVPPFLTATGEMTHRYGLTRCYSFFEIHISFGCACAILLYFYLFLLKYHTKYINRNSLVLLILLLVVGILLSNSKTPLVGLIFFLLAFYNLKFIFNPKLLLLAILVIFTVYNYTPGYIDNIVALFDNKVADDGGGSTNIMRMRQFEIGLELFSRNPLLGNGIGSIAAFMKNITYAELYGSESSWLKILIERGILGCIAYLYLYVVLFRKMKEYLTIRETTYFLLGLIAMETATGFMNFALFISIIIVICKYFDSKTTKRSDLTCC